MLLRYKWCHTLRVSAVMGFLALRGFQLSPDDAFVIRRSGPFFQFNFVTSLTSLLIIPLELGGETTRPAPPKQRRIFAPEGGVKATEERSPVVRIVEEETQGDVRRSSKPEMVAGAPIEVLLEATSGLVGSLR